MDTGLLGTSIVKCVVSSQLFLFVDQFLLWWPFLLTGKKKKRYILKIRKERDTTGLILISERII